MKKFLIIILVLIGFKAMSQPYLIQPSRWEFIKGQRFDSAFRIYNLPILTGDTVIAFNPYSKKVGLKIIAAASTPTLQQVTTAGNTSSNAIYIGSGSLDASAAFQVESTTKGILPPVMTTAQKNAISSPANGLVAYDATLQDYYVYKSGIGSGWKHIGINAYTQGDMIAPFSFGAATQAISVDTATMFDYAWSTTGNDDSGPTNKYIGTKGAVDFPIRTNNIERILVSSSGSTTFKGNLLFTDNTYDIGASGATRPRTGYFGTSLNVGAITGSYSLNVLDKFRVSSTGGTLWGTGQLYVSPTNLNTLNSGYASASNGEDFWFNYSGYNDGAAYSRNLYIGNGKNGIIAKFDGSNSNVSIGPSSAAPVSKLCVLVAPTANPNYGLVSLGSGAFDGSTSGFFTGSSAGTLIAGNLPSGSTSDLFNFQLAGVNRIKGSSTGVISAVGGGNFGGAIFNSSGTLNMPSGIEWHASGYYINYTNNFGYDFLGYGGSNASSGNYYGFKITNQTIAQSGTAGYTDFIVNRAAQSSVGSGNQLLADFQVAGASKANISNVGNITCKSVRGTAVTFANVPTPVEGMMLAITDSTTDVWGATITGGGSIHVLAYYNGTNWTVFGK